MLNNKDMFVYFLIFLLSVLLITCHVYYHIQKEKESFTTITNIKQQVRPFIRQTRMTMQKYQNTVSNQIKKLALRIGL